MAAVVLAAFLPASTHALSGGVTGYSGMARPDGAAPLCNKCHAGGVAPLPRLEGPQVMEPNETATFDFVLESLSAEQTYGGLDVAADGGELAALTGEGEQVVEGELTHTAPRPATAGIVTWRFSWTAPRAPGAYTIFAAGNSVNHDAKAGGDLAARTTLDVVVAGETFTPAPTDTVTPTPTASPTPSSTPTPIPLLCAGDCNEDGRVMVDELIRGVQVSLGTLAVETCDAFDPSGDGTVSIVELVAAVRHSLEGCE